VLKGVVELLFYLFLNMTSWVSFDCTSNCKKSARIYEKIFTRASWPAFSFVLVWTISDFDLTSIVKF